VGSRDTKKTQEAGSKTPGQRCGFEPDLQFDTRSQTVHSGIPQIESR
jgi:hypothetical protein